jgi:hypothetical protein
MEVVGVTSRSKHSCHWCLLPNRQVQIRQSRWQRGKAPLGCGNNPICGWGVAFVEQRVPWIISSNANTICSAEPGTASLGRVASDQTRHGTWLVSASHTPWHTWAGAACKPEAGPGSCRDLGFQLVQGCSCRDPSPCRVAETPNVTAEAQTQARPGPLSGSPLTSMQDC